MRSNKLLQVGKVIAGLVLITALTGCGGGSAGGLAVPPLPEGPTIPGVPSSPTGVFQARSASILTYGYANGNLVASARFIDENTLEITNTEWRFVASDGVHVTPSQTSTYRRDSAGNWNPEGSVPASEPVPNSQSVIRTGRMANQNGFLLGGIADEYSARPRATIGSPGSLLEASQVAAINTGALLSPVWAVAATPGMTRVCVLGTTFVDTRTRGGSPYPVPTGTPDPLPEYHLWIAVLEK
ncbi:MAG: hypothetical protein K0S20_772 [Patescibacteria group bacterium]|jgi:hypothetical protein|nr:hypothetical protein [Patescibacteria group bacterium]